MSDNISKKRPLSPHLSIYKPQISSVLSAGHRISGIGLFLVISIISWWFIFWVFSSFQSCYLTIFDYMIVKVILFIASYGFFYHLSTGIRHLMWDSGNWFSIKAINYSGWAAITLSVILTIIFWCGIII